MSSGTVVLAAGAMTHVVVAPTAGSSLTRPAATVLVARAAAEPDAVHRANRTGADAEDRWGAAARAAVRANGEARILRVALRRAEVAGDPAAPPAPRPVQFVGRSLDEVTADAERTVAECTAVRSYLAEHRRRTAAVIAESVRSRAANRSQPSSRPPGADPGVSAAVDRLLATVPEDAEPGELAGVHAAALAARVEPSVWLPELETAVERLRTNVARSRRQASEAAGYLESIAAIDVDQADPRIRHLVMGLGEVVAGERDLTESLRDNARLITAAGESTAANRLLADRLRDHLRADGFDVGPVSRSGRHETMEVTHPALTACAGRVRIGRGEISYRVAVCVTPDRDHHRWDAEWRAAVAGSITRYGWRLADSGIGVHMIDDDSASAGHDPRVSALGTAVRPHGRV